MSELEKLLPCPFCGGAAKNNSHSSCDCCGKAYTGVVSCTVCGAEVSHLDTDELAIAAWNTRAVGWQPIETIPQNGDDVLACDNRVMSAMVVVSYDAEEPTRPLLTMDGPSYSMGFFTHWQPLPSPPEDKP